MYNRNFEGFRLSLSNCTAFPLDLVTMSLPHVPQITPVKTNYAVYVWGWEDVLFFIEFVVR